MSSATRVHPNPHTATGETAACKSDDPQTADRSQPVHKRVGKLLVTAAKDLVSDDAMVLAAALAFYAALSFAPLVMLTLWASSSLGVAGRESVVSAIRTGVSPEAAEGASMVLANADGPGGGLAGALSIAFLIFAASGVFAQLQRALNTVFDVEARPAGSAKGTISSFVRTRVASLGVLVSLLFLLAVSLVASTAIGWITRSVPGPEWLWTVLDVVVSIGVFTMLFAAMLKLLPDVRIAWRDALIGGLVIAVMFTAGKLLLGYYLNSATIVSSYGAAGTLVALLIWVYYSAIIVFFGAEVTQARLKLAGRPLQPNPHAVRMHKKDTKDA